MILMLEKLQEIIKLLMEENNLKVIQIENNSVLVDLGLSSLDFVTMVCEVEKAFNLEIPDRVIWGFKTVQDVINYIQSHNGK